MLSVFQQLSSTRAAVAARFGERALARRCRAGMALVYTVCVIVAVCAIISLAVDYGHVQLVKTEMRRAVDAAGRYAASGVYDGTYISKAQSAAVGNKVDGADLSIAASDVVLVNWDPTLTPHADPSRTPKNAVQVSATRTVPTMFARVIGFNTCTVSTVAVMLSAQRSPRGIIGLSAIDAGNNTYVGSYRSSSDPHATQASAASNGALISNGPITGGANSVLNGAAVLGPTGNILGFVIHGPTVNTATSTPTPPQRPWTPVPNPAATSADLVVGASVTKPAGTYWLTGLTVGNSATLSFDGKATVYINGPVRFGQQSGITAYDSVPANLKIYQIGNAGFGDGSENGITLIADLEGPASDFFIKDNLTMHGSILFKSVTVKNNAEFYYDEDEGYSQGGVSISTVK